MELLEALFAEGGEGGVVFEGGEERVFVFGAVVGGVEDGGHGGVEGGHGWSGVDGVGGVEERLLGALRTLKAIAGSGDASKRGKSMFKKLGCNPCCQSVSCPELVVSSVMGGNCRLSEPQSYLDP